MEKSKLAKGLGCGFLILLVLIGLFSFFQSDMETTVKNQLAKLRENRITQAYYDYTAKKFQETTPLESFREFLTLYPALSENKRFSLDQKWIDNHLGYIEGRLVSKDLHEMNVEYQLIQEDGKWKILSIRLKEGLSNKETEYATDLLVNTVREQLATIQKNDFINAYYGFLSSEFQKETPMQVFKDFLKMHPILGNFENLEVNEQKIENGKGHVKVTLDSSKERFPIDFSLVREEEEWKIWSLRVTLPASVAAQKAKTDPNALNPPVELLLDQLSLGKTSQAYDFLAKEFQEATSFESFTEFVNENPILEEHDLADIKASSVENGTGKVLVNLHNEEGMTVVEFKLGFEEGRWNIWGMTLLEQSAPQSVFTEEVRENQNSSITHENSSDQREIAEAEFPPVADTESNLTFSNLVVGNAVDDEGLIKTPLTLLKNTIQSLYVNVFVENGRAGSILTVYLEHVDSATSAPPLQTTLAEDNDTIVSFSYSSPSTGWPPGKYLIKIAGPKGEEIIEKFEMVESKI